MTPTPFALDAEGGLLPSRHPRGVHSRKGEAERGGFASVICTALRCVIFAPRASDMRFRRVICRAPRGVRVTTHHIIASPVGEVARESVTERVVETPCCAAAEMGRGVEAPTCVVKAAQLFTFLPSLPKNRRAGACLPPSINERQTAFPTKLVNRPKSLCTFVRDSAAHARRGFAVRLRYAPLRMTRTDGKAQSSHCLPPWGRWRAKA